MHLSRALAAVLCLSAATALAQRQDGGWTAEAAVAAAARGSVTQQSSFTASVSGISPTYLRLGGGYTLGAIPLTLGADVRVDAYKVTGDWGDKSVATGALGYLVGATGSWRWQPSDAWTFDAALGYGLAGLPALTYSWTQGELVTSLLNHHGLLVGAGASYTFVEPFRVEVDLRALPRSFGGRLAGSSATAWDALLGVRLGLWQFPLAGQRALLMAEYELHAAQGRASGASIEVGQAFNRFGLALRLSPKAGPPTGPGLIRGRVLAGDTGKPIAGATIKVGATTVTSDRAGEYVARDVGPGPVAIEVSVGGYRVARDTVEVPPASQVQHASNLVRRTGPGVIQGVVRIAGPDGQPGAPIAGAELRADGGASAVTAADGSFRLEPTGPGPVNVVVNAKGFKAAEEVVSVPPEAEAQAQFTLAKSTAKTLASVRGQVRSSKGGGVAATLRIPEARVNTRADKDGNFMVRIPGGRYTVVFAAPGFVAQTKTIEVGDGDQALFYVDLSPAAELH